MIDLPIPLHKDMLSMPFPVLLINIMLLTQENCSRNYPSSQYHLHCSMDYINQKKKTNKSKAKIYLGPPFKPSYYILCLFIAKKSQKVIILVPQNSFYYLMNPFQQVSCLLFFLMATSLLYANSDL